MQHKSLSRADHSDFSESTLMQSLLGSVSPFSLPEMIGMHQELALPWVAGLFQCKVLVCSIK